MPDLITMDALASINPSNDTKVDHTTASQPAEHVPVTPKDKFIAIEGVVILFLLIFGICYAINHYLKKDEGDSK